MVKINQVGIGRKSSGTIDGITYVTRGSVTYARSAPTMPASMFNSPAAKKRQAVFKMIQMHLKYHLKTIRQTIIPKGNGNASNRYFSLNFKALTLALDALAEQYVAGEDVTITDVENAISTYAAEHPTSITIGSMSGYRDVFLTGAWPDTITMNALVGDSTVIIIVNENGVQTSYHADGTVSVSNGNGAEANGPDGTNGTDETNGTNETDGTDGTNGTDGTDGANTGGNTEGGLNETGEEGSGD
jgi:hypothetical protein